MARIRTIKPEFFASSQVAQCSVNARMLFVGLWCFSDDQGVHPDDAHRLKMEVFPGDSFTVDDVQQMLDELISARLVRRFPVGGGDWLCVPTWKRHQRIDKPTFKHPTPPDEFDERSSSPPREVAEPSPPPHPRIGREGIGKEGIRNGMEEKSAPSQAERSADDGVGIDSDGDDDLPPSTRKQEVPPRLQELIDAWNGLPEGIGPRVIKTDSREILKGWKLVQRDAVARVAFEDVPKLIVTIRSSSSFLHGQPWFKFVWLFAKDRDRVQWNVCKIMEGSYANRIASNRQPLANGPGHKYVTGGSCDQL